jgi:hypothetical protein
VKWAGNWGQCREFGKFEGFLEFWGKVQRRGVHVKPPEIGSRDGVLCFWGNLRIHAELRRNLYMAIWDLRDFWRIWAVVPREAGGGGALLCILRVLLGEYWCWLEWFCEAVSRGNTCMCVSDLLVTHIWYVEWANTRKQGDLNYPLI